MKLTNNQKHLWYSIAIAFIVALTFNKVFGTQYELSTGIGVLVANLANTGREYYLYKKGKGIFDYGDVIRGVAGSVFGGFLFYLLHLINIL